MAKFPIKLVMKNYDHVAPLASGDVAPQDIDLTLDRHTSMLAFMDDDSYQAGEMSFSQYLIRRSQGESRYVGLPIFPTRAYRHRCFLVKRGSGMSSLKDLEGKRVGTNGWPDTGNTWSRAALREQGVDINKIDWWVGPIDDPQYDSFGHRPQVKERSNVHSIPSGRTQVEMLLAGDLDGLMIPITPKGFYEKDSPIVRLIPDYRTAEREYASRVGFYPAHHIIALKRDVFEKEPWLAQSLLKAFEDSRQMWQSVRFDLADTAPWLLPELEETEALLGPDWQTHGLEPNRKMIAALCEEEIAQGLVEQPIDPSTVFEDFERAQQG